MKNLEPSAGAAPAGLSYKGSLQAVAGRRAAESPTFKHPTPTEAWILGFFGVWTFSVGALTGVAPGPAPRAYG